MDTTRNARAASAPHAHGSDGIASNTTTGESYCPPSRRRTQRQAILAWLLERGSISTSEARRDLDIMSPAARVLELKRQQGLAIISRRDPRQHCARYHLIADQPEAAHGE